MITIILGHMKGNTTGALPNKGNLGEERITIGTLIRTIHSVMYY